MISSMLPRWLDKPTLYKLPNSLHSSTRNTVLIEKHQLKYELSKETKYGPKSNEPYQYKRSGEQAVDGEVRQADLLQLGAD